VPAAKIRTSLEQIASWLPDTGQLVGKLDSFARCLRVQLPDGNWAEPSGQLLIPFGQDLAQVVARVRAFPREESVDPEALWNAEEAEDRGDLAAAAKGYEQLIKGNPDAEVFFNFGNILYQLGREGTAAEQYIKALDLDPDFAEAWNNLGNALVAIGKSEEAIEAYCKALALVPEYPDAHCNLATILERLGRLDEAAAHRAEFVRAFPSEAQLRLLRSPSAEDGAEGPES
jgi:superkiller protein 3